MKEALKFSLFCMFSILLLQNCSVSEPARAAMEAASVIEERDVESSAESDKRKQTITTETPRKIAYTVNLYLFVDSLQGKTTKVLNYTRKHNGYVVSTGSYSATVRVPINEMEKALEDFRSIGKVTDEVIHGEDRTATYIDYALRLENAEKTRQRYLELLQKAQTVTEILEVERELERVNEKIESYKTTLKNLTELTSFSTITVYFNTNKSAVAVKRKPGILGYVFVGLYKGIRWLFVRDIKS